MKTLRSFLLLPLLLTGLHAQAQTGVLTVDCSTVNGTFRDLTGVNLGPNQGTGTAALCYQDIGVSGIRTHDYRGPCDYQAYSKFYTMGAFNYAFQPWVPGPSSYNWLSTNTQISNILSVGSTPFFRLGISFPTMGTTPATPMPKDADGVNFHTFAGICKRTAMHYTAGWDNGFTYSIPYWEVWNEPNHPLSWTMDSVRTYYRMYQAVWDSIKAFNPALKVGGPATASSAFSPTIRPQYLDDFFHFLDSTGTGIDFYSFHSYEHANPWSFKNIADTIRYFAAQNNVTVPEIILSEAGIDHDNALGYQDSPLGCAYLASVLLTADIADISKVFWYSGIGLGPLCQTDTLGAARLTWNGYAYKAYHALYSQTPNRLAVTGNEYVNQDFEAPTNLLLAAGKSQSGDTVNALISNLGSSWSQLDVHFDNLTWQPTDGVDVYITRVQSGAEWTTTTYQIPGNLNIVVPITGVTDAAVYLVQMFRSGEAGTDTPQPEADITVYPNPARSVLHIRASEPMQEISLVSIAGKTVKTLESAAPVTRLSLPVQDLAAGVYYLRVTDAAGTHTRKVVLMAE